VRFKKYRKQGKHRRWCLPGSAVAYGAGRITHLARTFDVIASVYERFDLVDDVISKGLFVISNRTKSG
jgi:hypothetical protein